jgi:hypothetical protein
MAANQAVLEVEQDALGCLFDGCARRFAARLRVVLARLRLADGHGLAELCDHLQSHHGHFVVKGGHGGLR